MEIIQNNAQILTLYKHFPYGILNGDISVKG
jgi:hypothetical protein